MALPFLVVALYALMPVAIMTTKQTPSLLFYVATALCLALALRGKARSLSVLTDYKLLLPCLCAPLLAVLISSLAHSHFAGISVEAGLRVSLCLLFLLMGLRQIDPRLLRQATWGIHAAAIAAATYVVYLSYPSFGASGERPDTSAIYNAVGYGNLMLLLAVLTLFSLGWHLTAHPRCENALKWLVAAVALLGFILTQTRSGWVAVPVFAGLGVALMYGFKRPWRALALLVAILAIAAVLAASSPFLRDRVALAYTQTLACFDTGSIANTSVCIRFQLWRAAWHAFLHNPIVGLGDHGLFSVWMKTRALADGVVSSYVANNYGEPHNDMMQALSSFGILGGIGLLLMYFAPAWLFIRRLAYHHPRQTRVAAAMGAAFCLGFAIFGLTELMFRGIRTVGLYAMFVAFFLVLSEDGRAPARELNATGPAAANSSNTPSEATAFAKK